MKIDFYKGDPYELTELVKLEEKDYKENLSFYHTIKGLELSSDFEKLILDARKKLNIPIEGYSIDEYKKVVMPWKFDKQKEFTDDEIKLSLERLKLKQKIVNIINRRINSYSILHTEIEHIIYANFVVAPPDKIMHTLWAESEDEMTDGLFEEFQIILFAQVSKNELINYINNNWSKISKDLEKLGSPSDFYISKRDYRIIELRDKNKLTFKKIVNEIIKEFKIDDIEGKVNEDAVKTAYRRAKNKILLLTTPQKGNN